MTFDNKWWSTWFLHPSTGLIFALMRNACTALFPPSLFLGTSFLIAKMCLVAQWPPGMHILVCYAPHNVSHYSSWLYLCSLVEALKINEAFVLNQEAIYEYSSTYNKRRRLLFLSITKGGGGWCLLNKRENKEQKKMNCVFLTCKQFTNGKASTS